MSKNIFELVVDGSIEDIQDLIDSNNNFDINAHDPAGNTALHLAIYLQKLDIVKYLLSKGANPTLSNLSGWTPLEEAQASGLKEIIEQIYVGVQHTNNKEYKERLPKLVEILRKLPDFEMEFRWEFKSWVPFLWRFCPSDTYKVFKRGTSLRMDSTLMGFEHGKWLRGNISMILKEDKNDPNGASVIVLDYNTNRYEHVADSFDDVNEDLISEEIDLLMAQELLSTTPNMENVKLDSMRNWLGSLKTSKVGDYRCKLFSFEGVELRVLRRSLMKQTINPPFDYQQFASQTSPTPLLHPNESVDVKQKSFRGTIFASKEFPRSVEEIFSLLSLGLPKQFFQPLDSLARALPPGEFPLKIEIPVFPTVTAIASFEKYVEHESPAALFEVPADFEPTLPSKKRKH
jgi:hypothetical protein